MDLRVQNILNKMDKVVREIGDDGLFYRQLEDTVDLMVESGCSFEEISKYFYKEFIRFLSDNGYQLYLAYGSNMNLSQMDYRCPDSFVYDKVEIPDYKFVLDRAGVATIIPSKGHKVEALLWVVHILDVETLDMYEGVRFGCYEKTSMEIEIDSVTLSVLVYFSLRDLTKAGYRSDYMDGIIKAAEEAKFSKEYIEELKTWNKDVKMGWYCAK